LDNVAESVVCFKINKRDNRQEFGSSLPYVHVAGYIALTQLVDLTA